MSGNRRWLLIIAGCCMVSVAQAYEQATHAALTESAFILSDLGNRSTTIFSPLVKSLGVDGFATLGVATGYFEFVGNITGVNAYPRKAQDYERKILGRISPAATVNLALNWLIFGAIREDDNPSEDPPTPQDVGTGISRPLHHFFDPYSNKPLNAPGLDAVDNDVRKNVDWAIGARDSFSDPNSVESPRRNRFTVFDARESMFRALTLMTNGGSSYGDISGGI